MIIFKHFIIVLREISINNVLEFFSFGDYNFYLKFGLKKIRRYEIIENRIYIRGEFTGIKCKTAILLYCFHTADVLHIFALYTLLGPGISFYRKSKETKL